ncbi:anthranilate phosphoribosyltransferase [Litchfieldia salsa]|uniref:Anthranilate phosphoribosyltransferase n=1 Tax=Litchfieldia salsa TaxID=930152 RepID=A0A1H0WEX7_9BACI|nr:anthranilate phosphoribosyltransferase [Litchfieldia salsa]SDP89292.1 anthranilate phosphoribosyltransferase [Litchfieldia salsa]
MFKELLNKCVQGNTLSEQDSFKIMNEIMEGRATASQIASLLSIMRFRGETVDEMTGFARAMRTHMTTLEYQGDVIDTCGTGGDGTQTFNISTASAIIVSSLGVKVAKHGNRAVSSKSGSADVLEKLGIETQGTREQAITALNENGMSFLFAPLYHSAMRHAVLPRKEIGFRTIFNLLGPLSNPTGCKKQVIGVYSTDYAEKMAETLKTLGSEHVLFVTGRDGLDEVTITNETDVVELKNGQISRFTLKPEDVGLTRGCLDELVVSSSEESAAMIQDIMCNKSNESATNIVIINSAVALYVAGKVETINKGVLLVKDALQNGLVKEHFNKLRARKVEKYA